MAYILYHIIIITIALSGHVEYSPVEKRVEGEGGGVFVWGLCLSSYKSGL